MRSLTIRLGFWSGLLGVVFGLIGCADAPEAEGTSVYQEAPASPYDSQAVEASRQALLAKRDRTGEDELRLGDLSRQVGDWSSAQKAYYDARTANVRAADGEHRALLGLARVALAQRDPSAAMNYSERAEQATQNSGGREEARVLRALAHLERGQTNEARRLRTQVSRSDIPELSQLDSRLGSSGSVVSTPSPRNGPRPAAATTPKPPRSDFPAGAPAILARERWGARALNQKRDPVLLGAPRRVTVHHTAESNLPGPSFEANAERMRAYQHTHQDERKWADIGYHFVIDRQARIWEGRDLRYQGAHAGNKQANEGNIGIALMGDFEKSQPSEAQKRSLFTLTEWLLTRYRIAPSAVYGHDEVAKKHDPKEGTTCPGKHLERYIIEMKRLLKKPPAAQAKPKSKAS